MGSRNRKGRFDCQLTHAQVAQILTERGYPMTAKIAWHLEHQALRKLANNPMVHLLAREMGLLVPNDLEDTGSSA